MISISLSMSGRLRPHYEKRLATFQRGTKQRRDIIHSRSAFARSCSILRLFARSKSLNFIKAESESTVKFTNSAEHGFFSAMMKSHQARALSVFIECKNYQKQINNPELDQLSAIVGISADSLGCYYVAGWMTAAGSSNAAATLRMMGEASC